MGTMKEVYTDINSTADWMVRITGERANPTISGHLLIIEYLHKVKLDIRKKPQEYNTKTKVALQQFTQEFSNRLKKLRAGG